MHPVKRGHFLQLHRFLDFFNSFVIFSEGGVIRSSGAYDPVVSGDEIFDEWVK